MCAQTVSAETGERAPAARTHAPLPPPPHTPPPLTRPPAHTRQDVEDGDAVVHAQVVVRRVQLGWDPAAALVQGSRGEVRQPIADESDSAAALQLLPPPPLSLPDPESRLHHLEQGGLGVATKPQVPAVQQRSQAAPAELDAHCEAAAG